MLVPTRLRQSAVLLWVAREVFLSDLTGVKVGDEVLLIQSRWNREDENLKKSNIKVSRVGRLYFYAQKNEWWELKFGIKTGICDGTGLYTECHRDEAAYEASKQAKAAAEKIAESWREFKTMIDRQYSSIPPNLTQNQIDNMMRSLKNAIGTP